jgi:hypothetical protein
MYGVLTGDIEAIEDVAASAVPQGVGTHRTVGLRDLTLEDEKIAFPLSRLSTSCARYSTSQLLLFTGFYFGEVPYQILEFP